MRSRVTKSYHDKTAHDKSYHDNTALNKSAHDKSY